MNSRLARYTDIISQYVKAQGPKIAYIGGVHGSRNLGDETLCLAAEKLFPKCALIQYPRKKETAKLAKIFLPIKNGLLAGGTLINQKDIWFDLVSSYISSIPNFLVFGTGVSDTIFFKDRRKEWAVLLNQCRFVGVRGPLSADLLADVKVKNVEVIGDPALVFASQNFNEATEYNVNTIGINVGWDEVGQWGDRERIYAEIVHLAKLAKEAGWCVKWFVVCPADLTTVLKLATASNCNANIVEAYKDPEEYMRMVGKCGVFVGTRLHAVVLATCAYVPSLMLEYRPKCRDYMLSIGQSESVIRTDHIRAGEVWEKLLHLNSKRMEVSETLYHSIKRLRDRQLLKALELQQSMIRR